MPAGCGSFADDHGGIVFINGPDNDVIMVQALQLFPFCCTEADGCVKMAQVTLNEFGTARVTRIITTSNVHLFSNITGCIGFAQLPGCGAATSAFCIVPPQPLTSLGSIKIQGPGVDCLPLWPGAIRVLCNNGWVTVTIEGVTVSVQFLEGDTDSGVAWDLATEINSNPDLFPIVAATVSGDTVTVSARSQGVEYSYPWSSRCTYLPTIFSSCAFRAELSPPATLAPPAQ